MRITTPRAGRPNSPRKASIDVMRRCNGAHFRGGHPLPATSRETCSRSSGCDRHCNDQRAHCPSTKEGGSADSLLLSLHVRIPSVTCRCPVDKKRAWTEKLVNLPWEIQLTLASDYRSRLIQRLASSPPRLKSGVAKSPLSAIDSQCCSEPQPHDPAQTGPEAIPRFPRRVH